jgi:adenosylcobinamide-phosphate synthase
MIIESILVVGFAILLDFKFGDPKNKYHPTAWIGTLIAKLTPIAKNEHFVAFCIRYWDFFDNN